ncbi:hypothetical protein P3X46_005637 [Hevea brasiliensis]|uniref:Uncharacterized protein n=2 Tax=Hevea brasiliensis TaxID=3981 RepID=A0ABQ9N389_HEVBR|nr:hypothetical protein P3X46_005637 [Hevea brasiliensis]
MLITGFVLSSAPVVLPPLVVISALGFACSVPYGLFLATYACTEKIMNKLLLSPRNPIIVEDGLEKYGGEDGKFGGNNDMEEEETELKRMADMRFVPDEKGNEDEVNVLKGYIYAQKGIEEDEKEFLNNKDETVEKNGCDEKEDPPVAKNMDAAEETCGVMIVIEGKENSGSNTKEEEVPFEVTNVAVELCQGGDNEDNEELMRETRRLVEKIRDEGKADKGVEKDKQSAEDLHSGVEEGLTETNRNVKEATTQLGERNAYGQVGIEARTIDRRIEENGDKVNLLETVEVEWKGATERAPVVPKEQVFGKRADDNIKEEEKSAGRAQEHMVKHGKLDHQLNRDEEITISSNVDATEIADESAFNLFDDKNAADLQNSSVDYGTPEGSEQPGYKLKENADSLELTIPSREHALEHSGIFDQVPYSEENIWKQIDAMRTILGYTAARHRTCIEEVKALYIFTGVEPPASFKDSSDLVEVGDRLRFLMSIVGVK